MADRGLAVVVLLPQPIAAHVQAWRRALRDPASEQIAPHVTLIPPLPVADRDLDAAVGLVERAAQAVAPCPVTLRGAGTFLPVSPVTYLRVADGAQALAALEQRLRAALEQRLRAAPLEPRAYPFHPHVTVAQGLPESELRQAAQDLAAFEASFPLREVLVLREGPAGGWAPLGTVPVGAAVREVAWQEAVSAGVFLVDLDPPRVLLGLRAGGARRWPGAWDAVGGRTEPGEPLLAALLREAGEEASVAPLDLAPLGCFHDGERADAYYMATAWQGEPRNAQPSEHARLEWVPLGDAPARQLPPTTRRALTRLLELLGRGVPAAVPGSG